MKPASLLVLLLSNLPLSLGANTGCFNPNGSEITNPAFQPCNQVLGTFSTCCGTNWTGGKVGPDTCEPNGLCLNSANGVPLYWRGSCSDPTWKSPNCLANLCTNTSNGGDPTTNVPVILCSDGTWCCGGSNTTCCEEHEGTAIAATIGLPLTTSTKSTSMSTAMQSSSTSSSSPNADATPQPAGSTSAPIQTTDTPSAKHGATASPIGIGVGVAGGAIAIFAVGASWFILRRRRTTQLQAQAQAQTQARMNYDYSGLPPSMGRHELPGHQQLKHFKHEIGDSVSEMGPVEIQDKKYSRGF